MNSDFVTYRKFNDVALAAELTATLDKHDILYRIDEEVSMFNPTFYTDETSKDYLVKIAPSDFDRINALLTAEGEGELNQVEDDHYLFAFSNEELMDVLRNSDEWSPFDFLLAKKILSNRGVLIDDDTIAEIKQKRIKELSEPDGPQTFWIVMGYIFAFLGGIIGVFIGWHLSTHTKILPNGQKVFGYNSSDRSNGRVIFYLSLFSMILGFVYQLVKA